METTTARTSPSGSGVTAPTVRPWADLPRDLLLDVSNRLDDAADFVRFHAVCTPWRGAAPSLISPAASCPTFSPWLLTLCGGQIVHTTVGIRSIPSFKEASDGCSHGDGVVAEPQDALSTGGGDRNWVVCAGGTAVWIFVASPQPRLVDLLTGAVTPLPSFPDDDKTWLLMENARGIVYGDGTVFLYRILYDELTSMFTVAILRPVDAAWKIMKWVLEIPTGYRPDLGAVYHDGKVLACVGKYLYLRGHADSAFSSLLLSRRSQGEERNYFCEYNYVLESKGELLSASVLVEGGWFRGYARHDPTPAPSVMVHTLVRGACGVRRWVVEDGRGLGDRVFFLGSPASFAVDAHELGVVGRCAYFVFGGSVFRYGFVDGETHLLKKLPRERGTDEALVWAWPQPTIAPIQEIRQGLSLHPNKKLKSDLLY